MEAKSSLPEAWVTRIFDKLAVTYGAAWVRKWEGVDGEEVKANWGHELRGFQQSPHAIKHALEHLPPAEPPTVLQFRDLCLKAPQFNVAKLPAPKADPEVVAKALAAVKVEPHSTTREWAHRLREREQRGDRLTIAQRDMWRAALRVGSADHDSDAVGIDERKRHAQEAVEDRLAAEAA